MARIAVFALESPDRRTTRQDRPRPDAESTARRRRRLHRPSAYDELGRLFRPVGAADRKRVDGDGVETDYAYDAANRRTSMTFPAGAAENTVYTWDQTAGGNAGIGRLTKIAEASGSTSFTYDAQGRKTAAAKVISGGGFTTPLTVQYAYDANGKITQITYPDGDKATYARATDGQLTGVTSTPAGGTAQNIATAVTFAPFGPIAGFAYGNGLTLARGYDQDYRLTALTVAPATGAAVVNLGFTWQADGRLASVTDLVGNRTPAAPTATLMKAALSSTANQVLSTTTLANAAQRTLTYKPGGDLAQDARVGGATYGYVYNAAKRLASVTQNGTGVGVYAYDFQGNRVYRQVLGANPSRTAYVYDEAGHLLAEHDAVTGAATREYVWIDDMPVALVDISGTTFTWGYIHTGQIDEPLAVTNAAGALAWNGYVDPTGNGSTFTTPSVRMDMRLPGQSFELEPGGLSQAGCKDNRCQARYEEEESRCYSLRNQGKILRSDLPGCISRAQNRLRLCIRNGYPAPDNQGGPYEWDPRNDGQRYRRLP